jgi:hypothetical protein
VTLIWIAKPVCFPNEEVLEISPPFTESILPLSAITKIIAPEDSNKLHTDQSQLKHLQTHFLSIVQLVK